MRTGNNYSGARWAHSRRRRPTKGTTVMPDRTARTALAEPPPATSAPTCGCGKTHAATPGEPVGYMNVTDIGNLFQPPVASSTVQNWRLRRYSRDDNPERIAGADPFPDPCIVLGLGEHGIVGWHPDRAGEIIAWNATRPGRGAGGGRPRKEATD